MALHADTFILQTYTVYLAGIGGHLLNFRDQRYRTELDIGTSEIGLKRAESDIISDIGTNFYPISDIQHPKILKSAQWLRKQVSWVQILLM
jgi:hypothetical protein